MSHVQDAGQPLFLLFVSPQRQAPEPRCEGGLGAWPEGTELGLDGRAALQPALQPETLLLRRLQTNDQRADRDP